VATGRLKPQNMSRILFRNIQHENTAQNHRHKQTNQVYMKKLM